ncbi:MAG: M23 family metallopeptidase [Spirochaetaceae bacterium]|jgi:murein DD-endopeptidase MepM/ murein hydrolase activator NlpD|nr:M23 family metallopeptidase [Spirochaetaceae bacterium]
MKREVLVDVLSLVGVVIKQIGYGFETLRYAWIHRFFHSFQRPLFVPLKVLPPISPKVQCTPVRRRFGWHKLVLRAAVVFGLLVYLLPDGFTSLTNLLNKGKIAEAERSFFEAEAGMGGMPYFELGLLGIDIKPASLEKDALIAGIPEPVEYSKPKLLLYTSYTVQSGDIISNLAQSFGLNQDTLISVNGITNSRLLQINQVLRVPNQDGILYSVKKEDTLESIATKFETPVQTLQTVNELFSDSLTVNAPLFIPGARLERMDLQEINGDLFIWPVRGYITSPYGYRSSPFTGIRQFHSGMDIGVPLGTPIRAAMSGRVTSVGYDKSFGNFVVISHHAGYRTLYAHMSVIRTKSGDYVDTGERIGDAGSTGLSTGPHLHFTVYKNGVTINPRSLIK